MLPLLQYALKETWALREGSAMTAGSYARSGGVREAIRLTAERTFDDLSPDDQQAARVVFLRLVTPGEGQEDTRARAAMPVEPALRKIVDQFSASRTRLLVTGSDRAQRPTVEVAHEALIRTWPRLRDWIGCKPGEVALTRCSGASQGGVGATGTARDLLLPAGFQLERARALAADPGDLTIDDVKGFIAESEAVDDRRRAEDAERERQRQAAELEAANVRRPRRAASPSAHWRGSPLHWCSLWLPLELGFMRCLRKPKPRSRRPWPRPRPKRRCAKPPRRRSSQLWPKPRP